MKCFHHNDNDGRVAAAIVKQVHPEADLIECNYGAPPKELAAVVPGETVFIVDFSFKPDVMESLLFSKPGVAVVWLDHHKTAKDYGYAHRCFGIQNFTTPESGCELTWRFLCGDKYQHTPDIVSLVGAYDSWRKSDGDEESMMAGLDLHAPPPSDVEWWRMALGMGQDPASGAMLAIQLISAGETCIAYRNTLCADYLKSYAFEAELFGHKCLVNGIYRWGAKAFGERINDYPLCCSYVFNGKAWTIGVYSVDPAIHCGELCQTRGGGGHKGAAGFQSDVFPFAK